MQRIFPGLMVLCLVFTASAHARVMSCNTCPMAAQPSCHNQVDLSEVENCCCPIKSGELDLPLSLAGSFFSGMTSGNHIDDVPLPGFLIHGTGDVASPPLAYESPPDPLHVSVSRYLSVKSSFII